MVGWFVFRSDLPQAKPWILLWISSQLDLRKKELRPPRDNQPHSPRCCQILRPLTTSQGHPGPGQGQPASLSVSCRPPAIQGYLRFCLLPGEVGSCQRFYRDCPRKLWDETPAAQSHTIATQSSPPQAKDGLALLPGTHARSGHLVASEALNPPI